MDTTYFGRDFSVMVFMDNRTGKVQLYRFVHHETVPVNYFQTTPKRVLLKNYRSFSTGLRWLLKL